MSQGRVRREEKSKRGGERQVYKRGRLRHEGDEEVRGERAVRGQCGCGECQVCGWRVGGMRL